MRRTLERVEQRVDWLKMPPVKVVETVDAAAKEHFEVLPACLPGMRREAAICSRAVVIAIADPTVRILWPDTCPPPVQGEREFYNQHYPHVIQYSTYDGTSVSRRSARASAAHRPTSPRR